MKARAPQDLLDKFWLKMAHMFGNTWTKQYGVDPAGNAADTWSAALAGVTPAQIALGLQAALARGLEWPPSAPRFRAMCMGIPSIASVRHDMGHLGEFITPFVRQFWTYLNTGEYNSGDQFRCERAVSEAYELTCEHVMRGWPLPPPVAGVIKHEKPAKPVPANDETVRRELARMAEILGSGAQAQEQVA
ncbi:hypothetical protein DyAD56_15985 [Dyella sp. AD56]|uniref:hypothetical protein n=1 Tax=Dyella sp. AD56 TaxID=1528744 RepID=UPI000C83FF48|nr:hypothetical protein [Dyella sp. AD56]PMQ04188.1 hypothetical protein DyAD56_15985 [Dyella sp. AD56]